MIHARARHKQPLLIVWACIRRLDLPSTLHSSPSLRPPSTWCWHGTHALHDEQLSTSASAPLHTPQAEWDRELPELIDDLTPNDGPNAGRVSVGEVQVKPP